MAAASEKGSAVRGVVLTVAGAATVAGMLAWALAGKRDEFSAALARRPSGSCSWPRCSSSPRSSHAARHGTPPCARRAAR